MRSGKFSPHSLLAIILAVGMFVGIFDCHISMANDFDYTTIFTFTSASADAYVSEDYYKPQLVSDYVSKLQEADTTKLVIPQSYDEKPVAYTGNIRSLLPGAPYLDEYITEIEFDNYRNTITAYDYGYFSKLEKISYLYTGTSFTIGAQIGYSMSTRQFASDNLKEIYIYANGISTINASAFAGFTEMDDFKIYVKNTSIKEAIIDATKDGDYAVDEKQIDIIQTSKLESKFTIQCDNVQYGNDFQPSADIEAGDGTVTYTLYYDADCTEKTGTMGQGLFPGTYYLKGTIEETATYLGADSDVLTVEILSPSVDTSALQTAINSANSFLNTAVEGDYDATAWSEAKEALRVAQTRLNSTLGIYDQDDIDEAKDDLEDAMSTLRSSVIDTTDAWNELQTLIAQADQFIADYESETKDYTDECIAALRPVLADAKALVQDTASNTQIRTCIQALQAKVDEVHVPGLQVAPGEAFAYVKHGAAGEVKLPSITADANAAGAKKVVLTFDTAADTDFSKHTAIRPTVKVGTKVLFQGAENNEIKGEGETNPKVATYSAVVPLSEEIKEGDVIEISVCTYNWAQATDYVFAIRKVELATASGEILYAFTDATLASDNLSQAKADAEALDTSEYTAESVAVLNAALDAAEKLAADASAQEVQAVADKITAAIKALVKKVDVPIDDGSNPINGGSGSGGSNGSGSQTETKVLGLAKGKTFTVGNFTYKVTTAATITGTKKTTGAVSVTGLTTTGKKKTSVSVKNTVANAGASYKVTAIGSAAFKKAVKLKKATLGTNIKTVPANAFNGCKKLTTVSAKGVTKIAKGAFTGCKVLKKLTVSKLSSVKKGAFKSCKKTITVSGGTKKVRKANVKLLKKSGYKKFK